MSITVVEYPRVKGWGEGGFAAGVRSAAAGRRDKQTTNPSPLPEPSESKGSTKSSDNANGEPARRGESSIIARVFAGKTTRIIAVALRLARLGIVRVART